MNGIVVGLLVHLLIGMVLPTFIYRMAGEDDDNTEQRKDPQKESGTIRKQRASLVARLGHWLDYVNQPEFVNVDLHTLKTRIERGKALFFAVEQGQLHMLDVAMNEEEERALHDEINVLDDRYTIVAGMLAKRHAELLAEFARMDLDAAGTAAAALVAANNEQPVIKVQMPTQQANIKNTWGKFDGDLLKWKAFKQRYEAVIHNQAEIEPGFKFSYLQTSLAGEAASVIGGYAADGAGYEDAWARLNKIYDPAYPIARAHLREFYRMPGLSSPPKSDELRRMSSTTGETIRQLRALGYPAEQWDMLFVHALHERLDQALAKEWDKKRKGQDFPEVQKMIEFLDECASAAIGMDQRGRSTVNDTVHNQRSTRTDQNKRSESSSRPSSRASSTHASGSNNGRPIGNVDRQEKYPCGACKGDHKIFDCSEFKPLGYNGRVATVNKHSLCRLCLKGGHAVARCWDMSRCGHPICKQKNDTMHNSMICPNKVGNAVGMSVVESNNGQASGNSRGKKRDSSNNRRSD